MPKDQSWINDLLDGYRQFVVAGSNGPKKRNIVNLVGASAVDNPNYIDPATGLIVGATDVTISGGAAVAPLLVAGLRLTSPQGPHDTKFLEGFAAQGDGGQGVFVWNSTDTRTDNAGTIIKVTSITTGRWNRVIEQNGWSIKWFGCVGDGVVADEGPAFNRAALALKAEIDRIGNVNPETGNGPHLFAPSGRYKFQTIPEMPNGMWLRGEGSGDQTVFVDATHTVVLMHMGAFNNGVENIGFMGGKAAIKMWGPTVNFGNLDVTTSFGSVHIRNCRFRAQAFPSIYLDTSTAHRGSPSTLIVDDCDFYTGTVFYGGFDACWFHKCTVLSTDAPDVGPDWGIATPLDSLGHRLGVWNSYDSITIDDCFLTPGASGSAFPSTYVIRGCGNITMKGTHVGGETSLGVVQTIHDSLTFDGQPLSTVAFGSGVELRLFDNILACTSRGSTAYVNGRNVVECYDIVPSVMDIRQSSPNGTGGLAGVGLVWIDSVTIPKSAYTNIDRNVTYWNIEGFPDTNFVNLIRTGTDPQSPDGENVTPYFLPYMKDGSWPKLGQLPTAGQVVNLWPANKQTAATADAMPGSANGALGSAETKSGYGLVPWVASSFPSTLRVDYYHVTDGLPRGVYTLSFHVLSDVSTNIQVRAVSNAGSPLNVIDNLSCSASAQKQRLAINFYHDGSRSNGFAFTAFTLPFADAVNPVTAHFHIGAFKLEPGLHATDFGTGHATELADGAVVTQYYVNGAAPTAGGPFRTGDVAWNINYQTSNVDYWRCVGGGSPGSWEVGNVLPFDPSQAPGYSGDFDAALLTPGAITQWNDKSGATPYNPQNLTGHATAFASGGTGPAGAAYVKALAASSDYLTFLRSSVPITNEGFLVVRWDGAGTDTTGTLFDGGIINSFHLERNASTTQFILTGDGGTHPTISTGDQSAWEIWHFSADGTTLKLDVGGTSRLSVASAAGGISNGLTLFARGASGGGPADYSNCSIARAIFYYNPGTTLSTPTRNSILAYLNAKYALGVVGAGDVVKSRTVTASTDSMLADDCFIYYNRSGGGTETLPAPVAGKRVQIANIAGSGNVTIAPNASETVQVTTLTPGSSVVLGSDGTNWYAF